MHSTPRVSGIVKIQILIRICREPSWPPTSWWDTTIKIERLHKETSVQFSKEVKYRNQRLLFYVNIIQYIFLIQENEPNNPTEVKDGHHYVQFSSSYMRCVPSERGRSHISILRLSSVNFLLSFPIQTLQSFCIRLLGRLLDVYLFLLSSVFPVIVKFSKPCFLIMYHRNYKSLLLMLKENH